MQEIEPVKQDEKTSVEKLIDKVQTILVLTKEYENKNATQAQNLHLELKKIFNKICLEIDDHFESRVKDIYQLFKECQTEEQFYLLKRVILIIIEDLRKKFEQSKVIILYYSTLIQMLNQIIPRISDIFIGLIYKKFPIFYCQITPIEQCENEEAFLLQLGFDKTPRGVKLEPAEEFSNLLEGYSILFFGISGVGYESIKKFSDLQSGQFYDYSKLYLDYLEKLKQKEYWRHPFIAFVLKNYIKCSSELFQTQRDFFLKEFEYIQKIMLPKIESEYTQFDKKYKLLNADFKKEIQIGITVLQKTLKQVLEKKTVIQKYTEYDKEAREE